jgi:NAD(P)-dependent dehydrogenase (short-subunit alcohol dehydrogenase family)
MTQSLSDQTVVILGGSAGIGLATAQAATAEGAGVILTGRDHHRLEEAAKQVGAAGHAAFDVKDFERLREFFWTLDEPVDHVLVSGGGPFYAPLADMDIAAAGQYTSEHVQLTLEVAKLATTAVRPGGSLLFISGTGGRRTAAGLSVISLLTVGMPAMTKNLALELAPIRVNLIAPGFVDTPLSASLLGDGLDARRAELREKLPIGRVVGPDDVAALAVHLMVNTALTGATYDVDGGQQII